MDDKIIQSVGEKFPSAIQNTSLYLNEVTLEISPNELHSVLSFLKQEGYKTLMDLSAVDYLVPNRRTEVFYWLHDPKSFKRIRITQIVARNEKLPSVTDIWEGANWYERELFDMFGIEFTNHPDLTRILMPDDWKGHPLRRDYSLTEEPVEFKHDVKPKVPSEIIPYVESNPRRI